MITSIENKFLKVAVQHLGAEICSIKSKKTGKEYMWNANPDIWGSFAPVLFPIIGSLKNNKYTYQGASYSLPKHGFIRNNSKLILESNTPNILTFSYKFNEETLKMYPFEFIFTISFRLKTNTLEVHHKIENAGNVDMLFSLGAHPGYKCPINPNESYEDYYIEFENEETDNTWELNSAGLSTGKVHQVLKNTRNLPLTKSLFSSDALIFKNLCSKKVSLKSKLNKDSITIRFADFDYLGIWAKPNAAFVCIEPWLGITDDENSTGDFSTKEGMMCLKPNKTFSAMYSIEIMD